MICKYPTHLRQVILFGGHSVPAKEHHWMATAKIKIVECLMYDQIYFKNSSCIQNQKRRAIAYNTGPELSGNSFSLFPRIVKYTQKCFSGG